MTSENRIITACYPGKRFPTLSVTGERCDQMCEHCRGIHLRNMVPVTSPGALGSFVSSHSGTIAGYLLSGGCDINGSVPISGYETNIARSVEYGMRVNIHTGFCDRKTIRGLVASGVTTFSVDVHQDPEILSTVLHLDRNPEEYMELISDIIEEGGIVVPHVTVGFGSLDFKASVELIKKSKLKKIVLLVLVPTVGTVTEDSVLSEDAIVDAAEYAVKTGLDVSLGCMRDRRQRTLERRCIQAGIRRIANPSDETLGWARENGYSVRIEDLCCSISF